MESLKEQMLESWNKKDSLQECIKTAEKTSIDFAEFIIKDFTNDSGRSGKIVWRKRDTQDLYSTKQLFKVYKKSLLS